MNDSEKEEGRSGLLFDIGAGTSICAMSSAVFASQFLRSRIWERSIEKLDFPYALSVCQLLCR